MKKFEKFLRYAQKFEAFQTARKSKEIDDIQKLDTQKELLKTRKLKQTHLMDRVRYKYLKQKLKEPGIDEQQWDEAKTQQLETLEEFELQGRHTLVNARGSEFDLIAEMQGEIYSSEQIQEFKQLPEVTPDTFLHELAELTEAEHQKELEKNEKAILDALKKPERLELTAVSPKPTLEIEENDLVIDIPEELDPHLEQEFQPQSDIETIIRAEEDEVSVEEEKPKSVFFFRSPSPPSK